MDERAYWERNLRRFILFRVLFNARFYYPVFAILFLDLGLSAQQFALLNAVWAVAIVLLEVPSGALADLLGRRNLVVLACGLMVAEMGLLLAAPTHHPVLLLACVLANRICSGAAEAAASGADEALAYDSIAALGRASEWPALLERLGRCQSIAFVVSSLLGALVYDAAALNGIGAWFGWDWNLLPETTRAFPVWLTLCSAVTVLGASLQLREVHDGEPTRPSVRETLRQIQSAGLWILRSPLATLLIACALVYDSAVRIFLTFTSSYYRLIELPEATYGLWGSAFALIGFAAAPVGRRMVEQQSAGRSLTRVGALVLVGLAGCATAVPAWGLLFVVPLGFGFFLLNYVVSHHLNANVDRRHRATVLSFKGLSMNLAYGALGAGFAAVLAARGGGVNGPDMDASATRAFGDALPWLAAYFAGALLLLALFARRTLRPTPPA